MKQRRGHRPNTLGANLRTGCLLSFRSSSRMRKRERSSMLQLRRNFVVTRGEPCDGGHDTMRRSRTLPRHERILSGEAPRDDEETRGGRATGASQDAAADVKAALQERRPSRREGGDYNTRKQSRIKQDKRLMPKRRRQPRTRAVHHSSVTGSKLEPFLT